MWDLKWEKKQLSQILSRFVRISYGWWTGRLFSAIILTFCKVNSLSKSNTFMQWPHVFRKGNDSYLKSAKEIDSWLTAGQTNWCTLILGYSMAVANTMYGTLTIVGAPRYKHRGAVMVVHQNVLSETIDPFRWQVGPYNKEGLKVQKDNVKHVFY